VNAALKTLTAAAAQKDTPTLVAAMLLLDAKPERTREERLVLAGIFTALEQRHPEVEPHMEGWAYLEWGQELSYTIALLVSLQRAGIDTE
jgi:hypothetical protein